MLVVLSASKDNNWYIKHWKLAWKQLFEY